MQTEDIEQKNRRKSKWNYVEIPSYIFVVITSLFKIFLPQSFAIANEEVIMDILNAFDLRLIPWVFVLNIFGYWLKKITLPKWVPPTPLLLMLLSFIICTSFGWAHTDVEGAKAVYVSIIEYGIGNGAIVAMIAIFGYDSVHAFTKRRGFTPKEEK